GEYAKTRACGSGLGICWIIFRVVTSHRTMGPPRQLVTIFSPFGETAIAVAVCSSTNGVEVPVAGSVRQTFRLPPVRIVPSGRYARAYALKILWGVNFFISCPVAASEIRRKPSNPALAIVFPSCENATCRCLGLNGPPRGLPVAESHKRNPPKPA